MFRMSTGCEKVSQTDRKIYSVPGRQRDSMTVWQNSRAAKEPALVRFFLDITFLSHDLVPTSGCVVGSCGRVSARPRHGRRGNLATRPSHGRTGSSLLLQHRPVERVVVLMVQRSEQDPDKNGVYICRNE